MGYHCKKNTDIVDGIFSLALRALNVYIFHASASVFFYRRSRLGIKSKQVMWRYTDITIRIFSSLAKLYKQF